MAEATAKEQMQLLPEMLLKAGGESEQYPGFTPCHTPVSASAAYRPTNPEASSHNLDMQSTEVPPHPRTDPGEGIQSSHRAKNGSESLISQKWVSLHPFLLFTIFCAHTTPPHFYLMHYKDFWKNIVFIFS